MGEDYICPQGWRWNSIYEALRHAWKDSGRSDMTEPPHLLAPNASDHARKERWQETMEWAAQNGFNELIPDLPEDERYYGMQYV